MAYSTRDVLEMMTGVSGVGLEDLKVDGGAAANDWLMQFQADALGVRVARPDIVETTALGAAGLAGLAVGVWQSAEDFIANRTYRWFTPDPMPDEGYAEWKRAVGAALHWAREVRRETVGGGGGR